MKNTVSHRKYHSGGHAVGSSAIGAVAPRGLIPCSALGALIAVCCAVFLAFATSAIIYRTPDPACYTTPSAFTALYVSALIGGFAAARFNKCSALLCGLLVGVTILVLTFAVSLPIPNELSADYGIIEGIALRAAVIACSVIGAFIGVTHKTNKKRKNHKKR